MVRMKAGIGVEGSGYARFFHPSKKICDQCPNEHGKLWLTGVLITGKVIHRVNRKQPSCYECRIPQIDNGTVFHICCSNFKVEKEGATPFSCETVPTGPVVNNASPSDLEEAERVEELRTAEVDVASNIGPAAQDIAELHQQGIEVDDDNNPAPENTRPSNPAAANGGGEWVNPTTCPRRTDDNIKNLIVNWKSNS